MSIQTDAFPKKYLSAVGFIAIALWMTGAPALARGGAGGFAGGAAGGSVVGARIAPGETAPGVLGASHAASHVSPIVVRSFDGPGWRRGGYRQAGVYGRGYGRWHAVRRAHFGAYEGYGARWRTRQGGVYQGATTWEIDNGGEGVRIVNGVGLVGNATIVGTDSGYTGACSGPAIYHVGARAERPHRDPMVIYGVQSGCGGY